MQHKIMERTIETTMEHIHKQIEKGNNFLYLHMTEWNLYEMHLQPIDRAKLMELGYHEEVNPITGRKEKILAYKKIYPIFSVDIPGFTYI